MASAGVALYSESCGLSNSMITERVTPASHHPRPPAWLPAKPQVNLCSLDYAKALAFTSALRLVVSRGCR
jgi:hypothetical protein